MLFLSLSFVFDRAGAPNPFAPLFMTHDDGGFWCYAFWKVFLQESEKDGDRTTNVRFEPFPRLIWFMTLIVEFKILPTPLHHRFWAYVSSCHGRNFYFVTNNKKRHTIQIATIRFRTIYESFTMVVTFRDITILYRLVFLNTLYDPWVFFPVISSQYYITFLFYFFKENINQFKVYK